MGPSPPPSARRAELGAFLRARRAGVRPDQVGLPSDGSRRTPGLRREEVAALAGVGLSWYTWLEQARDVKPSAAVLDALAGALRLTIAERRHLFHLARSEAPLGMRDLDEPQSASLAAFTDAMEPHPAYVTTPHLDVLTWNRAAASVLVDFAAMPPGQRNLLWWLFTDERFAHRRSQPDASPRRTVGRFRAAMGRHPDDRRFAELVEELSVASGAFAAAWSHHEVLDEQSGTKEITRPEYGTLRFHHLQAAPLDNPDLQLTIYAPADTATRRTLEALQTPNYEVVDVAEPKVAAPRRRR